MKTMFKYKYALTKSGNEKSELWFRYLFGCALFVTFLMSFMSVWEHVQQKNEQALLQQTDRMTRLILSQAQHEAKFWFLDNNLEALDSLAKNLLAHDEVLEVSVYDQLGRQLIHYGHDLSLADFLLSLSPMIIAKPFVIEVQSDGVGDELLGFLRVTFDYERVMQGTRPLHREFISGVSYFFFISFLAGFLVALAFIKKRQPAVIQGAHFVHSDIKPPEFSDRDP